MKILFNTDQIYLHGGIEKVMATKANYFASLPGVEVFVVTAEQEDHSPIYPLDSRIRLIDLGINYNRSQSYFSKGNLRKAVRHYRKQKELFRSLKPDVVISPNFNFDHYWLPFIKGKALVIKERHSSRYAEEESPVPAAQIVDNRIASAVEILKSGTLAERVVAEAKLQDNDTVLNPPVTPASVVKSWIKSITSAFSVATPVSEDAARNGREKKAAAMLQQAVTVERVARSAVAKACAPSGVSANLPSGRPN